MESVENTRDVRCRLLFTPRGLFRISCENVFQAHMHVAGFCAGVLHRSPAQTTADQTTPLRPQPATQLTAKEHAAREHATAGRNAGTIFAGCRSGIVLELFQDAHEFCCLSELNLKFVVYCQVTETNVGNRMPNNCEIILMLN